MKIIILLLFFVLAVFEAFLLDDDNNAGVVLDKFDLVIPLNKSPSRSSVSFEFLFINFKII